MHMVVQFFYYSSAVLFLALMCEVRFGLWFSVACVNDLPVQGSRSLASPATAASMAVSSPSGTYVKNVVLSWLSQFSSCIYLWIFAQEELVDPSLSSSVCNFNYLNLIYTVLLHDVSCFTFRILRKWVEYVFQFLERKIKMLILRLSSLNGKSLILL
jgi:hypothetical protein